METNQIIIASINYSTPYDDFIKNESIPIYFGQNAIDELTRIENDLKKYMSFKIGTTKYKIERINEWDAFGKYNLGKFRFMSLYITDIENFKIHK